MKHFSITSMIVLLVGMRTMAQINTLVFPENNYSTTDTSLDLKWNGSSISVGYQIKFSLDSIFSTILYTDTSNLNNKVITRGGFPRNKTIFWSIRSFNGSQYSVWSSPRNFSFIDIKKINSIYSWYTPDSLVIVGSKIQKCYNLVDTQFSVSQSNAIRRPILGQGLLTNRKAIFFNGSSSLKLDSFLYPLTQPNTIYCIYKNSFFSGPNQVVYDGGVANPRRNVLTIYGTNQSIYAGAFLNNTSYNRDFYQSTISYYSGSNSYFEVNGMRRTGNPGSNIHTGTTLGSNYLGTESFTGYIFEFILFDTTLDNNTSAIVKNYLRTKYNPPVNLGFDDTIKGFCAKNISAPVGYRRYLWNTGDSTRTISINTGGFYSVQTTDSFGFISSDTIYIYNLRPSINISKNGIVCINESKTIDIPLNKSYYTYKWQDNSTDSFFVITQPGIYYVSIKDTQNCTFYSDTMVVSVDSFAMRNPLNPSYNLCLGQQLSAYTQGGVSYLWSTGDTTSAITPAASGQYSVTITNTNGCKVIDTTNVSIIGIAPNTKFSYVAPCAQSNTSFVDLSSATSGVINSWKWYFGDGDSSIATNPTHTYNSSGTYSVKLITSTNVGCSKDTSISIYVCQKPVASYTASTACAGAFVSLVNSSTKDLLDTFNSWTWQLPNSVSYTTKNCSHAFSASGKNQVTLYLNTTHQCKDTIIDSVLIYPKLLTSFAVDKLCVSDSIQFIDNSGSLSTVYRTWDFGDGNTSNLTAPKHKFNSVGNYTVKLASINSIGCRDTFTKTITTVTNPTVSISSQTFCKDKPNRLQSNTVLGVGDSVVQYTWYIASFDTFYTKNPQLRFSDTITKNAVLNIQTLKGCAATDTRNLLIGLNPKALFTYSPLYGQAPINITFTNASTNASSYAWNFGDGNTSIISNPTNNYLSDGTYNVRLSASNPFGCVDTFYSDVIIQRTDLDLALDRLFITENKNQDNSITSEVQCRIVNTGTQIITNAEFVLYTKDYAPQLFIWNGVLAPGATSIVTSPTAIYYKRGELKNYVCVEAVSVNNRSKEISIENNKICEVVSNTIYISEAYPNPLTGNTVYTDIYLPEDTEISISVHNKLGQKIGIQSATEIVKKGFNKVAIDAQNLEYGEYYLSIKAKEATFVRKFSKF